jgi:vacuolar-type H+-ATPase subunit D/Vma8
MSELTQEDFEAQLSERFKRLYSFLEKNMPTKADLIELRADLPTRKNFHDLQKSSDKLIGEVIGYRTEQAAVDHRLQKIENWITQASPNVGVAFQQ